MCQLNDIVGHIPIAQQYSRPPFNEPANDAAGDAIDDPIYDTLSPKPISISRQISADSVGVKIDPVALSSGQLRVLLRDANHVPLVAGNAAGNMKDAEAWTATFLFVHKS